MRSFSFKRFAVCVLSALLYPVYAYLSGDNKMLRLIDALTVTGLVFLAIGIVYMKIFSMWPCLPA
ncbi:MAG: hypothetical protein IKH57_18325 [Clostridia bacterium]|nr:hypothetical protein [Clostridia bacterium]